MSVVGVKDGSCGSSGDVRFTPETGLGSRVYEYTPWLKATVAKGRRQAPAQGRKAGEGRRRRGRTFNTFWHAPGAPGRRPLRQAEDITLGQYQAAFGAEQGEQDFDALTRLHALVNARQALEGSGGDANAIAAQVNEAIGGLTGT
jgi:hypothetical protein